MANEFTFAHREEGFDNHISHSIRGYDELHSDVIALSSYYVEDNSNVLDIGSSTGKTITLIRNTNEGHENVRYIGVESSPDFTEVILANTESDVILLSETDIRDYDIENCSFVTSLFTLQFMPRMDRKRLLKKIYDGMNENAAFVFAEKTISCNPRVQEILTFVHYDHKRKFFDEADILTKEKKLRSMLRPNTKTELIEMIKEAGFDNCTQIWQNHHFSAFIAIK